MKYTYNLPHRFQDTSVKYFNYSFLVSKTQAISRNHSERKEFLIEYFFIDSTIDCKRITDHGGKSNQ